MEKGYKPTPTIVEAAEILVFALHSVDDIRRKDAGGKKPRGNEFQCQRRHRSISRQ